MTTSETRLRARLDEATDADVAWFHRKLTEKISSSWCQKIEQDIAREHLAIVEQVILERASR